MIGPYKNETCYPIGQLYYSYEEGCQFLPLAIHGKEKNKLIGSFYNETCYLQPYTLPYSKKQAGTVQNIFFCYRFCYYINMQRSK
jgi:hypothetical protein